MTDSGHLMLFAKLLSTQQNSICGLAANTVPLKDHCHQGVHYNHNGGVFDLQRVFGTID